MTETIQEKPAPPANSWAYFDRIYCISLAHRPDRRESAAKSFASVGLAERVEFLIVDKHPTNSEQGIFESHMACLRAGLAAGAERILIFEDDILFRGFSPAVLTNVVDFLLANANWHMVHLGCFVNSSSRTSSRSMRRVQFRCCSHAYAVNRKFAEQLIQLPWRQLVFDDVIAAMKDEHSFAVYPSFAFQSDATTDNDKMILVDRRRRFFGGIRRLQRMNEFTARHRTTLILLHIALALLLAAIVLHHYLAK